MAQASRIEWTESTWNPVFGCSKVSAGCKHCYAERMAVRLAAMARHDRAEGVDPGRKAVYERVVAGKRWNGRIAVDEAALLEPYRWRTPRVVFVNSMSDPFHPAVPQGFRERMFAVMNACSQHTFQVLTKRPERAAALAHTFDWGDNIWMGTSVENRDVLERVAQLRRLPAAVRFISAEPLLGPLAELDLAGIHWLIAGGESGPGARPMEIGWVRGLRDSCARQGTAFFFKQWGGVNKKRSGRILDSRTWDEMPTAGSTQHREDQLLGRQEAPHPG